MQTTDDNATATTATANAANTADTRARHTRRAADAKRRHVARRQVVVAQGVEQLRRAGRRLRASTTFVEVVCLGERGNEFDRERRVDGARGTK